MEQANEALASAAADLERARQKRELVNCEKFRAETMRRRANRLQVSREKNGGRSAPLKCTRRLPMTSRERVCRLGSLHLPRPAMFS